MPEIPPGPLVAPDIKWIFGPMLLGVLLNTTLYGVMLVQMLMYFTRYKRDRTWFRVLALYLLLAETVNTVFDIGLIFEPLIIRYGTPKALMISPLMLRPDAAMTVAISTPVQLFVAWRVKVLTQGNIFPAIISILAIASLVSGILVTINVSLHPAFMDFPTHITPYTTTWLSTTAFCDVFLSAVLVYSLYTRKSGIAPTDRQVDRMIRMTVQTGSITAIAALLDLLSFVLKPDTTLNFVFDFPLSKLYTNALLSTLNARPWNEEQLRNTMNVLFEHSPTTRASSATQSMSVELRRRRQELSTFNAAPGERINLESGMEQDAYKSGPL